MGFDVQIKRWLKQLTEEEGARAKQQRLVEAAKAKERPSGSRRKPVVSTVRFLTIGAGESGAT
jgi:hypothetical protein